MSISRDFWVIELGNSNPEKPRYWNGEDPEYCEGDIAWSLDAHEAVRFARKKDAERVAVGALLERTTRITCIEIVDPLERVNGG